MSDEITNLETLKRHLINECAGDLSHQDRSNPYIFTRHTTENMWVKFTQSGIDALLSSQAEVERLTRERDEGETRYQKLRAAVNGRIAVDLDLIDTQAKRLTALELDGKRLIEIIREVKHVLPMEFNDGNYRNPKSQFFKGWLAARKIDLVLREKDLLSHTGIKLEYEKAAIKALRTAIDSAMSNQNEKGTRE